MINWEDITKFSFYWINSTQYAQISELTYKSILKITVSVNAYSFFLLLFD